MGVKIDIAENGIKAGISGDIDHHTAREIREEIDRNIEEVHPKRLVMDFREVNFMDSSGIGLVMGRYKLLRRFGGVIVITNPSAHIRKVMRLAGLDRLAVIDDSQEGRR